MNRYEDGKLDWPDLQYSSRTDQDLTNSAMQKENIGLPCQPHAKPANTRDSLYYQKNWIDLQFCRCLAI